MESSSKNRTIDQQAIDDLLEEDFYPEKKEKEKIKRPLYSENPYLEKETPVGFSGSEEPAKTEASTGNPVGTAGAPPTNLLEKAVEWVKHHPAESALGALLVAGLGYVLYREHTKPKAEPAPEAIKPKRNSRKTTFLRKRRIQRKAEKQNFAERFSNLLHNENEQGERVLDVKKTMVTAASATVGIVTGAVVAKQTEPLVVLAGSASLALIGVSLNNPLMTVGAIGVAAGSIGVFIAELVKKSLNRQKSLAGLPPGFLSDDKKPEMSLSEKQEMQVCEQPQTEQRAQKSPTTSPGLFSKPWADQKRKQEEELFQSLCQEEMLELA